MIPAAILATMALLDAMLAGFRSAAGRDAHIDKVALFRRWMFRGLLVGVGELVLIGTMLGTLLLRADDRALAFDDLVAAGARMLVVYVPYTVVVLAAFVAYAIPNLEVRSLATVVVLGP